MSEVLYRKYRPQTFEEVVGQDAVIRTLKASVASKRLAHAYLLCGPRGTGKTTLGRLIAKAANCASTVDGEPCNACNSCQAFIEGRAIDFIEQDAASHNSVDDIRQLRENVALTPMSGELKVYLLDEVHMLSKGAYNALLKTLEEPPPHIIFVLATTEPHKVEPTIISRCQRFDLKRINSTAVVKRLRHICNAEGLTLDDASLEAIARSASGSLRDAINGLEQVITYYGRAPTYDQVQEALGLTVDARAGQLASLAMDRDLPGGLKLIAAARDDGVDMRQFTRQLVQYLRGLLLARAAGPELLDLPAEMAADVKTEASRRDERDIIRALRAFGKLDQAFRDDPQSSLPLELAYLEFVADGTTVARTAAAERTPSPAPAPRPEPRFSIPAAELDDVASTVASTTLEPPREEEPPTATPVEAPLPPAADSTKMPAPASGTVPGLIEQVRMACKDTDKQLSALLNGSCEVKSLDGDVLTLGFYHTFHLERAESEPNASKLRELFSRVAGRPLTIVFEHTPRARSQTPPKGGHLVQAARELGARPITDRPQEGED